MLQRAALSGIMVYQQYISPRKGFACAYRIAHGGTGCSGFAKHAIAEHGLWRALPLIRQRFEACKTAAVMLSRQAEDNQKRKRDNSCSSKADCLHCACPGELPNCRSGKSGAADAGDCSPDCSPDCAPCGCGS